MLLDEKEMSLPQYIRRKLHNLTHPIMGRILMLHRVTEHRSEDPEQRELEITPQFLETTIKDYLDKGCLFVSIDEACDIILSGERPTQPFVCLTFDDGYSDNYTIALPLLQRLNIPFTVYVTTGFIDNRLSISWYPNQQLGLSRTELVALDQEPLCTIGAHTVSHLHLDKLAKEEQQHEILQSKQELEEVLGKPVNHFSYPHGAYNSDTLDIVKSAGFRSALMAWGGTVRRGDNLLTLHRIILKQN
jgi:peptidoglycan/xylan/chitin deacetylase (PgdA/CDA1 family)